MTGPLPVVIVVAAIIERQGEIFLARRDNRRDQAGLWEFPGGKVEPGESQPEALSRELQEELAIIARIGDYIASQDIVLNHRRIVLHAWHVPSFTGDIILRCHSEYRWLLPATAMGYALAPADQPLLRAFLKLK